MVNNDLGPTRAIIKYSGIGSGAAALSTAAKALGFETWGFFYIGDASSALGGNGNLQTWGPNWTLIGMEYGASQAVWDEVLALGKPAIGHIAPNQAAYDTAIAKGASGVQVSGVAVVNPVSWWNSLPYPVITGTKSSTRQGAGSLLVELPPGSTGTNIIFITGNDISQPTTPSGWTLVNWSTGNAALNMGIYTAPAATPAPTFTLSQAYNGGFAAIAVQVNASSVMVGGDGANTLTSPSLTTGVAGLILYTLTANLSDPPPAPVTFTYPSSSSGYRKSVVSAGTEGGVAFGIAAKNLPAEGPTGAGVWSLDNQLTTRAGTFLIAFEE